MKVREILDLLSADGWEVVATRGSHRQLKHGAKPGRVTVSGKGPDDLHPKTLASILRSGRIEGMSEFSEQAPRYLILIEGRPPSNYSAWSPDLPGCVATGESLEGVEREMRAAIAFHLEGLIEDGVAVPEPSGPGVYVERTLRAAA